MKSLILATCLLFGAVFPPGPLLHHPPTRLNLVLIIADDLGWADLACYGNRFNNTPSLDSLARRSLRFTQAYSACPVCSPSRAAIMTGQTPAKLGLTTFLPGRTAKGETDKLISSPTNQFLDPALPNLPRTLRQNGYATALVGKWHLGEHLDPVRYDPTNFGFDVAIGKPHTGSPLSYFAPYQRQNYPVNGRLNVSTDLNPTAKPGEYLTDRLTDEALGWLDAHKQQPFFMYLAHHAPHIPIQAKPELIANYEAKRQAMGPDSSFKNPHYAALLESLDQSVGRVTAWLRREGLDRNTVVIFTSDNGGLHVPEGPFTPATSNAPLRAGKGHAYEGGIRVPFIAFVPGGKTGVSEEIIWGPDLFPTLCELLNVPMPTRLTTEGQNVSAALLGGKAPQRPLYWHFPHYTNQQGTPAGMVRLRDWKLIEPYETGKRELYNLKTDPGETRNLASQHPRRCDELTRLLTDYRQRVNARMPTTRSEAEQPRKRI